MLGGMRRFVRNVWPGFYTRKRKRMAVKLLGDLLIADQALRLDGARQSW